MEKTKITPRRFILMVIGILLMGAALSILLQVNYGIEACSFMNASLAAKFGLTMGPIMIITNVIFFIPELIWGRHLIGIGTIVNMTVIGYTSDFCTYLENKFLPEGFFMQQPTRIIFFILGVALFTFSAAIYMNSGMGLAPYDSTGRLICDKWKFPFFIVRMIWDFSIIGIGILAGGHLTIGTIVLALTLGPIVSFVGKYTEKLYGKQVINNG